MIRLAIIAVLMTFQAKAMDRNALVEISSRVSMFSELVNIDWKVGDTANYNIDMGFIKGTMKTFVRENVDRGIWLQQDMDLGAMGKQKVEILIDKQTGATLELIVNGQKQDPPENDFEVVETREEKVTVPAGTYDSLYIKIKDKSKGEITEVWINPGVVPMSGMIKTIAPGQFGKVKVDMTGFKKQ